MDPQHDICQTKPGGLSGQCISSSSFEEYDFLRDDMLSLTNRDREFLASKGSFSLPSRELGNYFVEQFFKRIHPAAPVIDEAQFWRIWDGESGTKFSLFVFQALLFASCPVSARMMTRLSFRLRLSDHGSLCLWRFFKGVDISTREMHAKSYTITQRQGQIIINHVQTLG